VGANVGAHTLPLARAVGSEGRVIAVEPTAAAFERLCRNRDLNPELAGRIVPIQAALGAPGGVLQPSYYSAWPLEPAASRHPVHLGAERSTASARFSTLDDLLDSLGLGRVSVMKIDVDGGELDVLEGLGVKRPQEQGAYAGPKHLAEVDERPHAQPASV
jgi:FkbM family methyltransferase